MKDAIVVRFREIQPTDLDDLAWSGGAAHLRAVEDAMHASWQGDVIVLVGEVANQRLIALGALDLRPDTPKAWMLSVHDAWQSLGVGRALLERLEEHARHLGAEAMHLTVEEDNPRAKALYLRLGYRQSGAIVETWPLDDGLIYAAACDVLTKPLPKR